MANLLEEFKRNKSKEIFERFNPDEPYPKDIVLTMLMSAINEGYKISNDYKELNKNVRCLIVELQELLNSLGEKEQ